VGDDVTLDYP
jgi:hypothetical protein